MGGGTPEQLRAARAASALKRSAGRAAGLAFARWWRLAQPAKPYLDALYGPEAGSD